MIGKLANYSVICAMLSYISASTVYPVCAPPIPNGVIGLNSEGGIISILTAEEAQAKAIGDITFYEGVLVPGFVNTHCHLELSHLYRQIPEKTGLINFIKGVLSLREQTPDQITEAMERADREMFSNGIVAVADISNRLISKETKLKSELYYHTFVEVFGFNTPAEITMNGGKKLKADFEPLNASIVPHAPYSVSPSLFTSIKSTSTTNDLLSIHNQETVAENELFEVGTGEFAEFFASIGIAKNEAHGAGKNALAYHLPKLPQANKILLVHNTFTNEADLEFASKQHQNLYWCLCPNANLYIEDSLPDLALFMRKNLQITLGTDSLASNNQLSILSEMKTLQDQKQISFVDSLPWATLNGAAFLNIEDQYGSLTVGKKPGILHINLEKDGVIRSNTVIKRLF